MTLTLEATQKCPSSGQSSWRILSEVVKTQFICKYNELIYSHGLDGLKTQKVKAAVGQWVSRNGGPGNPDLSASSSTPWYASEFIFILYENFIVAEKNKTLHEVVLLY